MISTKGSRPIRALTHSDWRVVFTSTSAPLAWMLLISSALGTGVMTVTTLSSRRVAFTVSPRTSTLTILPSSRALSRSE